MRTIAKCEKDNKFSCKMRQNKNLECCIDDIAEELELLHPAIDNIVTAMTTDSINKLTFSRLMFVSDMINLEDDTDIKIAQIIKEAAYFCYYYSDKESVTPECKMLGNSFINETLKWYNHKMFNAPIENREIYLKSLLSDYKTINTMLGNIFGNMSHDCEDIFF